LALAFGFWLLAFGSGLLALGFWLWPLAFGSGLLTFGSGLLAFGFFAFGFGQRPKANSQELTAKDRCNYLNHKSNSFLKNISIRESSISKVKKISWTRIYY